jgi:hypothetical protein
VAFLIAEGVRGVEEGDVVSKLRGRTVSVHRQAYCQCTKRKRDHP